MRIYLDSRISLPLAIGFAGLIVLTLAAIAGAHVPTEAWGAWSTVIGAAFMAGAWKGADGRPPDYPDPEEARRDDAPAS